MYELALFAGAGGGILGGILCGHTCIGACEIEEYPREVLKQRQRDGILPQFPIWDDICTFSRSNPECEGYFELLESIRGNLIISGGFPCQDISAAGKGAGIEGSRSGLWGEMARIIGEVRPAGVFVENSPLLVSRGLSAVLGDLAQMGYDARWCVLGADDAGAPHRRKRIWIVAHSNEITSQVRGHDRANESSSRGWNNNKARGRSDDTRQPGTSEDEQMAHAGSQGLQGQPCTGLQGRSATTGHAGPQGIQWWLHDPAAIHNTDSVYERKEQEVSGGSEESASTSRSRQSGVREIGPVKSDLDRMVDGLASELEFIAAAFGGQVPRVAEGVPDRVNRLKAIGNGQVPAVVKLAWQTMTAPTAGREPL